MKGQRRSAISIALMTCVSALTVACSGDNSTETAVRSADATPTAARPSVATRTNSSVAVPTEVSDFPDGVYRTQLTVKRLQALGVDDPGNAGIWTLTVKSGAYRLDCRNLADPGVDCGNHNADLSPVVELGTLRGSAPTVWFVHDMARLARLTGCVRHSDDLNGCGPEGGYHVNWRTVPHGMAFSDFVGLGDEAGPVVGNWTAQPWTRIS